MSEIEKMERYIERTHMKKFDNYCLVYGEAIELCRKAEGSYDSLLEVISLAFNYGKAKGYRAAKAKMKEATALATAPQSPHWSTDAVKM